jgi:hypothetical protein
VDFNHLSVRNLAADLRFPVLKNDDILVDLRRLAFTESHGLTLESLSGRVHVTPQGLSFQGLTLRLPGTKLAINDMELSYNGFDSIVPALKRAPIHLQLTDNLVTPYDFRAFVPVLKNFGAQMRLSVDALRIGDDIQLNSLRLTQDRDLLLDISGSALNVINHPVEDMVVEVPNISFKATGHQIERCIAPFLDSNPALKALIGRCGDVSLDATLALAKAKARFKGNISTAVGDIDIDAEAMGVGTEEQDLQLNFDTDDFNLGLLTDNSDFGHFSAELESQISKKGKDISGHLQASVPFFNYKGYNYTDLSLDLE